MKAIILGAERGIRRLESSKSHPRSLIEDAKGRRVLDWVLGALSELDIEDVVFVGGYHIEKMVKDYPHLRYYYNPDWDTTKSLHTLFCAEEELNGDVVVIESDVIFRSGVLRQIVEGEGDIVVGILPGEDGPSDGGTAPAGLSESFDESSFSGVYKIGRKGIELVREQYYRGPDDSRNTTVEEALWRLSKGSGDVGVRLITDDWARIDGNFNLARFVMGSKGQTLERLRPILTKSIVLDQVRFKVEDWQEDSSTIVKRIQSRFSDDHLVVRSCAISEDCWAQSNAGRFRSEIGLQAGDSRKIARAVDSVIESYKENGSHSGHNEVFVQPHLNDVICSGVMFTRYHDTGAPYMVINYDDTTRDTDTVTSGRGKNLRTVIVYKNGQRATVANTYVSRLLDVTAELEELLGHDSLDIEFAFDGSQHCYLLQVRVLVETKKEYTLEDVDIHEEVTEAKRYVDGITNHRSHLLGHRTILANMPDWNPAEIIGVSPRPLAYSLFQRVIGERVWGQARANVGYRDTYPTPIVVLIAGHPYVDVRASLNSFLPATLDPDVGEKLVTHCLAWLEKRPEFHDKFEFEVALTCLAFDFETQAARLSNHGFGKEEIGQIREALRVLTDNIICGNVTTIDEQMALVAQLKGRRTRALETRNPSLVSNVRTIDCLLDDCKQYGTLPFSVLARYAFIATSFMKSLRTRGVFSPEEYDRVLRSIPSVATMISNDVERLRSNIISLETFLSDYGHLRPGTYDITSPSYSEDPEAYFGQLGGCDAGTCREQDVKDAVRLFDEKSDQISTLITDSGFSFSVSQLRDFILQSISMREQAKFEYTKNLSAALSLVSELGHELELSRDDISFLTINNLLELATASPPSALKKELRRNVTFNLKRHQLHKAIVLPHVIVSESDIDCFELTQWMPNYITSKSIVAPVVDVDSVGNQDELTGKIAFIQSADPGYDWVFGHGVSGIITTYGGAASHMAIRAAELGLPAAIGCGELISKQVLNAQLVELNCVKRQIKVIR